MDPAATARALVATLAPLAAEAGVQLCCDTAPRTPTILADARRLERILANLLQNALKYAPAGSTIRVLVGPAAGGGAQLAVEDEGPGIAAADLPYLFDAAYRGMAAPPTEGLGLGLSISRALARAHGGDLVAQNRPAGGARFTLRLPARPPAPNAPGALAPLLPPVTAVTGGE